MEMKKRAAFLMLGFVLVLGLLSLGDKTSFLPTKTGEAQIGDAVIGYRSLGAGAPLLLIMGYAGTMEAWDQTLVKTLASSRRVILFDNRGMGRSTGADSSFSIEKMAQDALALLDALGIEKADILGWSMGSLIAQEMAILAPEKTGKLILYGSAPDTKRIMKAVEAMETMAPDIFIAQLFPEDWAKENPDIFKRLPPLGAAPDPAVLRKQQDAMASWKGVRNRLTNKNKDILLIAGEEDAITPPEESLSLAARLPGAWVVRFKGAGHWLMYQTPEDFAKTVLLFLDARQTLIKEYSQSQIK